MVYPIKIDDLTPQKKLTKLPAVYKTMRRGSEVKRLDLTPIFDVILLGFFFFFSFRREISEMKSRHDLMSFLDAKIGENEVRNHREERPEW